MQFSHNDNDRQKKDEDDNLVETGMYEESDNVSLCGTYFCDVILKHTHTAVLQGVATAGLAGDQRFFAGGDFRHAARLPFCRPSPPSSPW